MSTHPYKDIPTTSHWRHAVSNIRPDQIDPVTNFKFLIKKSDKIASAGSCFAQHIARHLSQSGFHYYVVEQGHPVNPPHIREEFNYGLFSARYGNIQTSRQLLQLFDRAFGNFTPAEDVWRDEQGNYIDPFRPTIQEYGFTSKEELLADRTHHLSRVKHLFHKLDYFIFTLGLTECWQAKADGAIFPICPGVAGGNFDENAYQFHNLSVTDVIDDLKQFQEKLQTVNKNAKIILTVSPVPLMATMEKRHVLVSTTLSKSILRVAADYMESNFENVAYFPSYEIITSSFSRGQYYGPDLRSVTEEGVQHVMRLFMSHATEQASPADVAGSATQTEANIFLQDSQKIVRVICDEDLL